MSFLFNILFLSLSPLWASQNVVLSEGETWKYNRQGRLWIEDGEVLRATEVGSQFQLKGLKVGQSEVQIGEKSFLVTILSRRQARTLDILKFVTSETLGLSVRVENSQVQVFGDLVRIEDWEKMAKACTQTTCEYQMAAKISTDLQERLQLIFEQKLRQIVTYPYLLEFGDEMISLHLPTQLPQLKKITSFLSRYGISVIPDSSSLEMKPMVRVHITVAEVKRSEAMKYGIEWPEAYKAQILPSLKDSGDPLFASISAMEKTGFGKVLASPNLMCKSGGEAEFLAGGEFPIKVINYRTQDIVWKKYGILLKVKPQADFSGRMSISLETEISSIDGSRSVDGIPGLYTNRLQSHFDLTSPQTIALSGLLKHESSEAQGGIPGLAHIPILGALFSSRDYLENKTELVIFVRPEILQFHPEKVSRP